jgi:hypothetical protein
MDKPTASAAQLKPEDYRLLAEFRRLLRQFLVFSEQQAQAVGLAPQQHQALLAIRVPPTARPPSAISPNVSLSGTTARSA